MYISLCSHYPGLYHSFIYSYDLIYRLVREKGYGSVFDPNSIASLISNNDTAINYSFENLKR